MQRLSGRDATARRKPWNAVGEVLSREAFLGEIKALINQSVRLTVEEM